MSTATIIKKTNDINNLIGQIVTIPDKYFGIRHCVINGTNKDNSILFLKDAFGNKYEIGINEVSFVKKK